MKLCPGCKPLRNLSGTRPTFSVAPISCAVKFPIFVFVVDPHCVTASHLLLGKQNSLESICANRRQTRSQIPEAQSCIYRNPARGFVEQYCLAYTRIQHT